MWDRTAWGLSFLLGRASVLLGVTVALAWICAFTAIIARQAGPRLVLPVEPPLIGLGLGLAGWLIARSARQPIGRYALAGVLFNALPLILAALLIWQHAWPR
ncbi:MAG: hypothetical protein P4L84_27350 [Isosphaeraceae bacterium]|nr:hypothetical protein [Isosphaeraceae bacterium]